MLLRKTLSLVDVSLKVEGDTGKFAGYASVFGGVDSYGDTIVKGAFEYSLKNNGKPKMFFNHDWSGLPIGKWTVAREDDRGLYVEGELTPGMQLSAEVRAAMKHETIDGLSIGGWIKKGDYDETETGRVIRRWSNLVEVSPVVFPADSAARVEAGSVKSADLIAAIEEVKTIRDLEELLREAAGLGKGAATALVARARHLLSRGDPEDAEAKAIALLAERTSRIAA